ncbi:MAG: hypothetical protein FWC80_06790 [Firmicutes bacterium]|nr:hypothetical protein [Bacillota bacterium]
MKKTLSIATLAAITAASAAGAVATRVDFRPRKEAVEPTPTIMTVAVETNTVNAEMFATPETKTLPNQPSQDEQNATNTVAQTNDFLDGTRNNSITRQSGVQNLNNQSTNRSGDYTRTRKNKTGSYNHERNARGLDASGNNLDLNDANIDYTGSRYNHNRMSDYGNYMHNNMHSGRMGNIFEGRNDCRTYQLKGDVYIVIPELSALDSFGINHHGANMHYNYGTGMHQTAKHYNANPNNTNQTRVDGTSGTKTTPSATNQHYQAPNTARTHS